MRVLSNGRMLLPILLVASCTQTPAHEPHAVLGDYLGQEPPGTTPTLFAPEFFADHMPSAFGAAFSPDLSEFHFVGDIGEEETGDILVSRFVDGGWTTPRAASFNSEFNDNDMCVSPDGDRMFWRSWRPLPGSETAEESSYIWTVVREDNGWSDPRPVEIPDSFLQAGFPSMTASGALYYPYRHGEVVGGSDIHSSRPTDSGFDVPVNLGSEINTVHTEGDMVVSADESFLVVAGWDRPDNFGGESADLYVSFRSDKGSWTELVNLGPTINTEAMENAPSLSPDGRFFFFLRYDFEQDEGGMYWVDASVIERLRPDTH